MYAAVHSYNATLNKIYKSHVAFFTKVDKAIQEAIDKEQFKATIEFETPEEFTSGMHEYIISKGYSIIGVVSSGNKIKRITISWSKQ